MPQHKLVSTSSSTYYKPIIANRSYIDIRSIAKNVTRFKIEIRSCTIKNIYEPTGMVDTDRSF